MYLSHTQPALQGSAFSMRGSSIFHAVTFCGKARGIGFYVLLLGQSYLKGKSIDVQEVPYRLQLFKNTVDTQFGSETRKPGICWKCRF